MINFNFPLFFNKYLYILLNLQFQGQKNILFLIGYNQPNIIIPIRKKVPAISHFIYLRLNADTIANASRTNRYITFRWPYYKKHFTPQ